MNSIQKYAAQITPPTASTEIFKDDCMYCFVTCFDDSGLNICLHCFQAFCPQHANDHSKSFATHQLYLNIKKQIKPSVLEEREKPVKMAKLEIKEKPEEELYDLVTTLYNNEDEQSTKYDKSVQDDFPMSISMTVDAVLKFRSSEKKEEIKAWEQEILPCEHSFDIVQSSATATNLKQCSDCDLQENLWICLQCGYLGCGRQQFGGVPGNSHAKAHAEQSRHAIAVKLGSLTFDSADLYCYLCNDEIKVPQLAKLLKTFDINILEFEKTEKSLTELQLEQNLKWEFNMDGTNGELLKPIFGEELTGFKNLGNSCYLATVLQVLFSVDAFKELFYNLPIDFSNKHPDKDLTIQLIKVANGLISGTFSVPDNLTSDSIKYQKGIKPSTFKALVGKDHAEFSTMKQQDASEFAGFVLEQLDKLPLPFDSNPVNVFKFVVENKFSAIPLTGEVKFNTALQNSIALPVKTDVESVDEDGKKIYKPITFESVFDEWNQPELIDMSNRQFQKQSGFKTFPEVLIVTAERIQLINWVPTKVDVPITFTEQLDLSKYLAKGQLDGETLIEEEDDSDSSSSWTPNQDALNQLLGMGFPEPRCLKALHNTGNSSLEDAMNWLFLHMEDPDIDEPFVAPSVNEPSSSTSSEPSAELISQIASMGFSDQLAKKALILNGNNPDMAINWIFENPDDDGVISNVEETSNTATLTDSQVIENLISKAANGSSTKYSLHAVICHKGSSLHSGHYVCFIKKLVESQWHWVLFNDEKVVIADESNLKDIESSGYMYIFKRRDD